MGSSLTAFMLFFMEHENRTPLFLGGLVPALKVRNELLSLSEVNSLQLLQRLVNWSYQGLRSLGMGQSLGSLPALNHCSKTQRHLCLLVCDVKSLWKAHA